MTKINEIKLTNMKQISVSAPSNIAFLKYWGKKNKALQWPAGNSLSMTLSKAVTKTTLTRANQSSDRVFYGGSKQASIDGRVTKHLDYLRDQFKADIFVDVETENSFPASCGIASSASGFAALTVAFSALYKEASSYDELVNKIPAETLSLHARMGSGSAGRSCMGGYVSWLKGTTAHEQSFRREYDQNFFPLCDLIVVLSNSKKAVSSSEAHDAAWSSPLFLPRVAGTEELHHEMLECLGEKDFSGLGRLMEDDALNMHAVAMTGTNPIHYLRKDTLNLASWIRRKRNEMAFEAYFTIDAGPNVHVICRPGDKQKVLAAIRSDFEVVDIIEDETGGGPKIIDYC